MDRTSELALIDEIADLLARGTTAMAPDVGRVRTVDIVGPARTEAERTLFTDQPIVVAPGSAVPNPGDFVADEIAGLPLLVVRGDDGVVRVFLNACRHRGNIVCQVLSGNSKVFSCEYHAWTYDRQGRCRSTVDRAGFAGLGDADTSLVAFPTEERHGLVWARLTAGAALDVAAHLGPDLDAELAGFAPHAQHLYAGETTTFPFNWKFGVNTFQELFHLAFLHRKTLGSAFISNVSAYRSYPRHQRLTVVRSTFPEMVAGPASERTLFPHCTLVYVLFPNTVFVWQLDHLEVWRFTPTPGDPGSCQVGLWLTTEQEPQTDKARRHWQRNWELTKATVYGEDFATMANIQRTVSSGALPEIVYGRNEIGLQDYYRDVAEAV